jgi:putative phosphoesterase
VIRSLGVDAILHGGDIGDLDVLTQLAELAPLYAVRGNIDERANVSSRGASARATDIPDGMTVRIQAGDHTVLTLLLMHIVVYGPKIRKEAAQLAWKEGAKLIVCGHSHVPFIGRDKGLTVFNPGSIGPRRLRLPIVLGLLEISAGKLSLRHIDCETGREWTP